MTSIKRQLKGSPRDKLEREAREKRIGQLVQTISEYDPEYNPQKFKQAIAWSEKYYRACQVHRKAFPFPDPLRVAEYLAKNKASADTITAAVLFSAVSPTKDKDFSLKELTSIGKSFDDNIESKVARALSLDAFELLPLKPGAKQSKEDQLIQARRAMMGAAEDKDVLELRGAYRVVHFMEMFEAAQAHTLDRQYITNECQDIRNLFAPVAYRAGLEYLRYDLLDWAFRVEEPERHERVKAEIAGDVTAEDLAEALEQLSKFAAKAAEKLGIDPNLLSIQAREKSPTSTVAKVKDKKKAIFQLGDLLGFQIVVSDKIYPCDKNFENLTKKQQGELVHRLGQFCHSLYNEFSKEFGRHSIDPSIVDYFRKLAAIDPDPKNPGQDDRYDDYINNPKNAGTTDVKSEFDLGFGYSAVQDTFVVRLESGKLIVLEGQIFDVWRGLNNKNHPLIGHVAYKTGMVLDAFMQNWINNAAAKSEGKPTKPGPIFVYNDLHELIMLPPGATVKTYAEHIYGRGKIPLNLQALVDNDDPLARRYPGIPYGLGLKLATGDRITSLQAGPR